MDGSNLSSPMRYLSTCPYSRDGSIECLCILETQKSSPRFIPAERSSRGLKVSGRCGSGRDRCADPLLLKGTTYLAESRSVEVLAAERHQTLATAEGRGIVRIESDEPL